MQIQADNENRVTPVVDAPTPSRRAPLVGAAFIAALAWLATGHVVAVPMVALSVIAALAAVVDARTARIPNRASIAALLIVVASIPVVSLLDDRPIIPTALGTLAGIAYSGAPVLFAVWLVRPAAIGGGDWKLLGALGAGVGLVLPIAALVMATLACTFQVALGAARRRRSMPFAPSIALGLLVTLVLLPALSTTFGGPYS